jgi:hypothetical protein
MDAKSGFWVRGRLTRTTPHTDIVNWTTNASQTLVVRSWNQIRRDFTSSLPQVIDLIESGGAANPPGKEKRQQTTDAEPCS